MQKRAKNEVLGLFSTVSYEISNCLVVFLLVHFIHDNKLQVIAGPQKFLLVLLRKANRSEMEIGFPTPKGYFCDFTSLEG